jgi:hypothetical protein
MIDDHGGHDDDNDNDNQVTLPVRVYIPVCIAFRVVAG